jgi:ribose transport system permease protein
MNSDLLFGAGFGWRHFVQNGLLVKRIFSQILADYSMLIVLAGLCVLFSALSWSEQNPTGATAAKQLAKSIKAQGGSPAVMIVGRGEGDDVAFADELKALLEAAGITVVETVKGEPRDARQAIRRIAESGGRIDIIAGASATSGWLTFDGLDTDFPTLGNPAIVRPQPYKGSNFLKGDNLLNIANQISIIAILAIGMTFVIITGGIDLSVGSLIAFSAVLATWMMREWGGATEASTLVMILCCLGAILACGAVGAFTGASVTLFGMPPFIITLSMMLIWRGHAFMTAKGQSVYEVPDSFVWLGRGTDLFGIPNAVVLMLLLYAAAHVVMSKTVLGRHVYAIGGNREAARLSGVPVRRVLLFVYIISGVLAGLGGVIMASQLKSGSPTYGPMYELYVIAAVVIGGTSIFGGEGKMLGTLIGAFVIAVIQNGLNLLGVEPYTQTVVLGWIIYGAVLFDTLKKRGWKLAEN